MDGHLLRSETRQPPFVAVANVPLVVVGLYQEWTFPAQLRFSSSRVTLALGSLLSIPTPRAGQAFLKKQLDRPMPCASLR